MLYNNGLAQGFVSSVIICNLCANFKLAQWMKEDEEHFLEFMQGYIFATTDHLDQAAGRFLNLHKKMYSDDSTLVIHDNNKLTVEERFKRNFDNSGNPEIVRERKERTKKYVEAAGVAIQRTGQLSVV